MHNRRGTPPFSTTPPVYPFHDRRTRDRFLSLVRQHLGRDGQEVVIENGMARVEGDPLVHGLTNLAQVCHQSPPAAWPGLVAEHLGKSERGKMEATVGDLVTSEYEQIAPRLAVRIHPEAMVSGAVGAGIVHRRDLPGTATVLVLDMPGTTMAVPVPIAERWGVPFATLIDGAVENLARISPVRWMSLPLPPDAATSIDALHGDFYASSHVLRAAAILPRTGKFGNLLGVPNRGQLLSYPLDGLPIMHAVEAMLVMTTGMYREGPGSITPHLFWRTPTGQFLLQQGSGEGGKVRFAPSPEFVELMARLRETPPG